MMLPKPEFLSAKMLATRVVYCHSLESVTRVGCRIVKGVARLNVQKNRLIGSIH